MVEEEGEEIKELPPRFIEFPFYFKFQISSVSYNNGNLFFYLFDLFSFHVSFIFFSVR